MFRYVSDSRTYFVEVNNSVHQCFCYLATRDRYCHIQYRTLLLLPLIPALCWSGTRYTEVRSGERNCWLCLNDVYNSGAMPFIWDKTHTCLCCQCASRTGTLQKCSFAGNTLVLSTLCPRSH